MRHHMLAVGTVIMASGTALAQPFVGTVQQPLMDRWMYPFNSAPGSEPSGPVFAALNEVGFDDRDAQFLVGFDSSLVAPPGCGPARYVVRSARLRVVVSVDVRFVYDASADSVATSYLPTDPAFVADSDVGKPVEVFAVGFRNGFTAETFGEFTPFSTVPTLPPQERIRSAFAATFNAQGVATDVSNHVADRFEAVPMAVGVAPTLTPGTLVPEGTEFFFDLNVSNPITNGYLSRGLNSGKVLLMVTSLHPASGGPGGPTGEQAYPAFFTKENALSPTLGYSARLELDVVAYPYVDFDLDGDVGTDADIEAFFACLGGGPGNADFDMDGDTGTDADIEAFFRALGGG
jgi:hypothetical protein